MTVRPSQRHDEITTLLNQTGEMTVEELAARLDVSRETIRRDLTKLDANGRIRKFHGGARSVGGFTQPAEKEGPFAARMAENLEGKKKIAVAAASLLSPEDSLFIDTGSTTVAIADELAKIKSLVIITNSPRIASSVSVNPGHRVFLIGGAYGADAGESLGPLALEQISKFRARYAVITVGAVDTHSLMDFDLQEAEVAKAMIERADKLIVVADYTKLDKRAVFEVAPLAQVDHFVTDRSPPAHLAKSLADAEVELVVA